MLNILQVSMLMGIPCGNSALNVDGMNLKMADGK